MYFKQRNYSNTGDSRIRKEVSKDLDVLMREPNTSISYLLPIYGALFRKVTTMLT